MVILPSLSIVATAELPSWSVPVTRYFVGPIIFSRSSHNQIGLEKTVIRTPGHRLRSWSHDIAEEPYYTLDNYFILYYFFVQVYDMMKTLKISEVRQQLPALLKLIEKARESIMITRYGKPVASIIPFSGEATERNQYPLRGMPITISEDFDEPMPDLWEAQRE